MRLTTTLPLEERSPGLDIDFMVEASDRSLQDLELASLNRAANLDKSIHAELRAWVEQVATARLARWMLENRTVVITQKGGK